MQQTFYGVNWQLWKAVMEVMRLTISFWLSYKCDQCFTMKNYMRQSGIVCAQSQTQVNVIYIHSH